MADDYKVVVRCNIIFKPQSVHDNGHVSPFVDYYTMDDGFGITNYDKTFGVAREVHKVSAIKRINPNRFNNKIGR